MPLTKKAATTTPARNSSSHSQVRLAYFIGRGELLGVFAHLDLAGLEDIAVIGDRERHRRVLLDEENGHALFVDFRNDVEDDLDDLRGKAERRLIQQE